MRELNTQELAAVSGGEVTPLITDPESELGRMLNDIHEAYINYLNMYVFPYIYYCF
jgi:bacteriocin-like protein